MKILFGHKNNGQKIFTGTEKWLAHRRIFGILAKLSQKKVNFLQQPNSTSLKIVSKLIDDVENGQPIGILQIIAISKALNLQIHVRNRKDNLNFKLGKGTNSAIDIEFNDGHWTLNNGKNPFLNQTEKNSCCFEVIAYQVNLSPLEIRKKCLNELRRHENYYGGILDKLRKIQNWQEVLDSMIGGARYQGRSPYDAARVIDDSQNGRCHPGGLKGHPRGHASHPSATGSDDSVENYSRGSWKTGFLSRNDQNYVGNLAFNTSSAQRAMESLNNGSNSEAVNLSIRDLGEDDLPQGQEFRNGSADGSPRRISVLTIVFRHHMQQQNNRMADVFVHTFYPRL
ncbi:uncharacterized protein LOC122502052 [Leptopilina heterotoma]|uniref:uncharacterized protein LOC122502052 n=1 Tax=Leptopilina heterotoma TaxID=63436 RepID=UPI001CA83FE6|nr:uncharacterized protein LOC122502052 [Leptopilina heterotoma]